MDGSVDRSVGGVSWFAVGWLVRYHAIQCDTVQCSSAIQLQYNAILRIKIYTELIHSIRGLCLVLCDFGEVSRGHGGHEVCVYVD
jgi:hypothetical protein